MFVNDITNSHFNTFGRMCYIDFSNHKLNTSKQQFNPPPQKKKDKKYNKAVKIKMNDEDIYRQEKNTIRTRQNNTLS